MNAARENKINIIDGRYLGTKKVALNLFNATFLLLID
jgi:hypothetical protein